VLIDGDPLTLVDTGVRDPASIARLEAASAARGRRLADLEQIVITHPHQDHFGAAADLVRRSGARVLGAGGAVTATFPDSFWPDTRNRTAYFAEAGAPEALRSVWQERHDAAARMGDPVAIDQELGDGDVVRMGGAEWRVVATPGHAADAVSLFQPEARLLLAGDILVGNGSPSVTLHAMPRPGRWLLDILDSLGRLAALDPDLAFPGHGPLIRDAGRVVAERRARAIQRLDEVADLVAQRPHSSYQLATAIYPPAVGGGFLGLSQAIGYLEALVVQDRAASEVIEAVRLYRRVG
jgi:glyoxylase-like metal-dependent hydrolase (beta-lactamase superfamily II)